MKEITPRSKHDCQQYITAVTLTRGYCNVCRKKFDLRFNPPRAIKPKSKIYLYDKDKLPY